MTEIGYLRTNDDVLSKIHQYDIVIPSSNSFIWIGDIVMINIYNKDSIIMKYDQDHWSDFMDGKIKECNNKLMFKVTSKYKQTEQNIMPWWSYLLHEETGTNFYMLDEALSKIDILTMYKPKKVIRTI